MRMFIAIDLTSEVKSEIKKMHLVLHKNNHRLRFTRIENLHLTLRFLGQLTGNQLKEIKLIVNGVAANHMGFILNLSKWGRFKTQKGSTVWIGVGGETDKLGDLESNLSQQLISFSGIHSFDYKPHITVARNAIIKTPLNNWLQPECISWKVKELILYQSIFYNKQVTYRQIAKSALR